MNTLIIMLDRQFSDCKKYADSYSFRRTYYDQAFGMVRMFIALYPNEELQVTKLWNEVYKPQFENLVYVRRQIDEV